MRKLSLKSEIAAYTANKKLEERRAMQRVALLCNCGIDRDDMLSADEARQKLLVQRLRRLLERERVRGAMRHWSYDLNRHIALKQTLDEICPEPRPVDKTKPAPVRRRFRRASG